MMNKLDKIVEELRRFFVKELGSRHITVIYGSYAYGVRTSDSDLDFFAGSENISQRNMENTLEFVFDLYNRYRLAYDEEVPHENKLLTTYENLEDAIRGGGFEKRNGQVFVPPVEKTREFLHSDEIAMRLLLNALTGKHIFVSGEFNYYRKITNQAKENLVGLMFSIDNVDSYTVSKFVQSLIGTPERNEEMYLGYKDKPVVWQFLTDTYQDEFNRLAKIGVLRPEPNGRYHLQSRSWLSHIIG